MTSTMSDCKFVVANHLATQSKARHLIDLMRVWFYMQTTTESMTSNAIQPL